MSCDVAKGTFEPYVHAIETNALRAPCEPASVNIVSCKNPNLSVFLEEVDGLDFGTVEILQRPLEFTTLIPIIDRGIFNSPEAHVKSEIVGISLKDIFSSAPRKEKGIQVLPKLLLRHDILRRPIFEGKKVILFCSGRDILIETLWQEFASLDFVNSLCTTGFSAVTGLNYSIFFGECPFSHALNLKKSLKATQLFQDAGINVIPHIYFAHIFHLNRWIVWLKENPSVTTVSVNCQFRSPNDLGIIEQGIAYLLDNIGREIKVILEGSDPRKMKKLLRAYPSSIIVALKGLSLSAQFHKQYVYSNGVLVKSNRPGKNVDSIFNASIDNYAAFVKDLSSLSLQHRSRHTMKNITSHIPRPLPSRNVQLS